VGVVWGGGGGGGGGGVGGGGGGGGGVGVLGGGVLVLFLGGGGGRWFFCYLGVVGWGLGGVFGMGCAPPPPRPCFRRSFLSVLKNCSRLGSIQIISLDPPGIPPLNI